GGRPKSEPLIGVDAARKAVAGTKPLIDERPDGVVRVEGVVEERELGEGADAQAAAFALNQQLEIDDAFFDERHRAVQSFNAFAARLQLISHRVWLDLPVARIERIDVLNALAEMRGIVVIRRVRHLNV